MLCTVFAHWFCLNTSEMQFIKSFLSEYGPVSYLLPGLLCATLIYRCECNVYRKRSILLSHIFVFIGAALSCSCVAAKAPEMLMLGRVFVGVNSGNSFLPLHVSLPVIQTLYI